MFSPLIFTTDITEFPRCKESIKTGTSSPDQAQWCSNYNILSGPDQQSCLLFYSPVWSLSLFNIITFFFFCILGPHLWHMEVPRLGVKSEPQQGRIRAMSETYTTARGNARPFTHWVRPGIKPATLWFLVRFVSAAPRQELQQWFLIYMTSQA